MTAWIPAELRQILSHTPELQRAYLVGGCVRDWLLGRPNKDFDLEVFGADYEALGSALGRWGRTDFVGRSFGVIKLSTSGGHTFDFSVPRRDSKIAPGHKGFAVTCDPALTPRDAAARRDFTINALMFDPRRGEVLDFFGGEADLRGGVLRHVGEAFVEDPLRVLRGMQFAARFDLKPAAETVELCRRIKGSYTELAVERVREEWFKWAEKSVKPSAGLRFLAATEWIEHFPEVHALVGTPQDPEWHPEGDVFIHTCHCVDALVELPAWQRADAESKIIFALAVLAHDFGKPSTTRREWKEGRECIVSPCHDEVGGALTAGFLARINAPNAIRQRIIPLVTQHLAYFQTITDRAVRRLARRLQPATIEELVVVMTADQFGRPPKPRVVTDTVRLLTAKAEELGVRTTSLPPILLGRHLIAWGMTPGTDFGVILHEAFEAQLEGHFSDLHGAQRWLLTREDLPVPESVRQRVRLGEPTIDS